MTSYSTRLFSTGRISDISSENRFIRLQSIQKKNIQKKSLKKVLCFPIVFLALLIIIASIIIPAYFVALRGGTTITTTTTDIIFQTQASTSNLTLLSISTSSTTTTTTTSSTTTTTTTSTSSTTTTTSTFSTTTASISSTTTSTSSTTTTTTTSSTTTTTTTSTSSTTTTSTFSTTTASISSTTTSTSSTTTTTITTTTSITTTTTATIVTKYIGNSYWSVCNSSCVNVSTSTVSTIISSWDLNNNLYDNQNISNGYIGNNGNGAYGLGYINNCLITNNNQYMIANGYNLFANRSFTVESWLIIKSYLNSTLNYGIFGQCQTPSIRLCLHLAIRYNRLYFGFYGDDIVGLSSLPMNSWFHVAFVYNFSVNQRSMYINGILDVSNTTGLPYLGTSGNLFVGNVMFASPAVPFPGSIDQVKLSNRAKTSCEIWNDATLVSYYSFDLTINDNGPNDLQSSIGEQLNNGISFVNGTHNQALLFSKINSYFQSWNYYSLSLSNQSYSYSLWIYPNIIKGTILHLSTDPTGSGLFSLPILSFSLNGSLVAQTYNGSIMSLYGPQIPINNWTHIALTWSSSNGLRLYINGDIYSQLSVNTYLTNNLDRIFLFLGTSALCNNCDTSDLLIGSYFGSIDEFYVYSRELTPNDICVLSRT